jgi:hypothetical protein
MDQLVRLGISWVWIGIEGQDSQYKKLDGIDTLTLVRELQSHGICVLGSTIVGLEEHRPENIGAAIDHAVRHDTDFHQFMLYTPVPGTPLHREMTAKGRMKPESELGLPDIHGQLTFNYRHPHIDGQQATQYLRQAFQRDFAVNGPSTLRIARTRLAGWARYKNHPDARVRRRYAWEAEELATTYSALAAAARLYFRDDAMLRAKMSRLLRELRRELGPKSWLAAAIGGRWLLSKIRREERGLDAGATREPPTFYERNEACLDNPSATLCKCVAPGASARTASPVPERVFREPAPALA